MRIVGLLVGVGAIGVAIGLLSSGIALAVPMAGATCASFATQQEAQYHYENYSAPATLDDDGDGLVCLNLPSALRREGTKIFSNTATTGIRFDVYAVDNQEWYLRVYGAEVNGEVAPFSTHSFDSSSEAIDYGRCYFAGRCE